MTQSTIGFLGAGNMGGALARAVRRAQPDADILICNAHRETAQALAEGIGGRAAAMEDIARTCETIFLGVKPNLIADLLDGLAPQLARRETQPLLISMAAGVSLEEMEKRAGGAPVIRILPNTPVAIGKGVTLYTLGSKADGRDRETFAGLLSASGSLIEVPEAQMKAAGVVAGCGPAFVDLFLEALADGGVYCGLPRSLSLRLAAEMTAGAAALAMETGAHPGALKDAVCSPGGSTIRGVRKLEEKQLRSAVMEAVLASAGKE